MSEDLSRRKFLRTSSAGALTVGIAGLAGCTSSLPFIGGVDSIDLDSWLFTTSLDDVLDEETVEEEFGDGDIEVESSTTAFDYVFPEPVFDNETELDGHSSLDTGSDLRSRAGVPASETDWSLAQTFQWQYSYEGSYSTNTSEVVVAAVGGDFETASIEDNLEQWVDDTFSDDDTELESSGSEGDFDLYEVEDYGFAVSEEYLLSVDTSTDTSYSHDDPSLGDASAALDRAVGARENDENLLADDDGEALLAEVDVEDSGNGVMFEPRTAETRLGDSYEDASDEEIEEAKEYYDDWEYGLLAQSADYEFDGETTELHQVFLYESESDADSSALSDYVDRNRDIGDAWETLEDYSVSDEGRALVLTGEVRTRSL